MDTRNGRRLMGSELTEKRVPPEVTDGTNHALPELASAASNASPFTLRTLIGQLQELSDWQGRDVP